MERLTVALQIASRRLFTSRLNLVIGAILLVGTALIVVGGSVFDSVDRAISRSIIGSVAGHIQIYSDASEHELAVFGPIWGGEEPHLAPIERFPEVKRDLEGLPGVKQVVPMGFSYSMVNPGNIIDLTLANLRTAVNARMRKEGDPAEVASRIVALKQHLRHLATLLRKDLDNLVALASADSIDPRNLESIDRVASDTFWEEFEREPLAALEYLENRMAPLMSDADNVELRYAGTHLDDFARAFDRMKIVDGTQVPSGRRGMLISKIVYENDFKLRVARQLDLLHDEVVINQRRIADEPELQRRVEEVASQTREVLFQLDAAKSAELVRRLQPALATTETDPEKLLSQLLTVSDDNFQARYALFYDQVVPLVDLYRLRIGAPLTLTAFTRAGYQRSVNVIVYGTFALEGLERSQLAGATSLIDLMSFRHLYGFLTPDALEETRRLKAASGLLEVAREEAEAKLFQGSFDTTGEPPGSIDEEALFADVAGGPAGAPKLDREYSREEIEGGVVLNAAVVLEESADLEAAIGRIGAVSKERGYGLRVVSWETAAGPLGQFTKMARMVLYVAVLIIFIVALVVINNAMVIAALRRVQEIGTLRAIGAQRTLVLATVALEILLLAITFGAAGSAIGAGVTAWLGSAGIPAANEQLYFFFSGPRLFPELGVTSVIAGLVIVIAVSVLATIYPALLAVRVSPVTAMQAAEE